MMAPELAKFAQETDRCVVAKINTEEMPALAERFGINGLPTLALFEQGKVVAKQPGAMPAQGIRQFVEEAVSV